MAPGKKVFADFTCWTNNCMRVTLGCHRCIPAPSICMDNTSRFYGIRNAHFQTLGRCVIYPTKSYPAQSLSIKLNCDQYKRFPCCATTSFAGLLASNKCLVNLYRSRKTISIRTDYGASQFVHPCPSGLIATKTKHPLLSLRTGTILLTRHPPCHPKPKHQWFSGSLKNGSCGDRSLAATRSTSEQILAQRPALFMIAARASISSEGIRGKIPLWQIAAQVHPVSWDNPP